VSDDDVVPVSVRLGDVVPPEDPEDWTRPLTWVAALGMLAGPLVVLGWFLFAPPSAAAEPLPLTHLAAATLAVGAAVTGGTQQGVARAWTATLGTGLFGALVVVIVGVVTAGERQVGAASPTLAHGVAVALGGMAGTVAASAVAAPLATRAARWLRLLAPMLAGASVAIATLGAVIGG
jgi:hypothetical protein